MTALRRRGEKGVGDQRILGGGEFVGKALSEMDDVGKDTLRVVAKRMDLPSLVEKVCRKHDVMVNEFRSGSRRHDIVETRRVLAHLAVKAIGYSGAEVARHLGVTTSCITRAASLGEMPRLEDYI